VTFTFRATIRATNWPPDAAQQIQYRWIRDDGGANRPTAATPNADGAIRASTTWQLGVPGTHWEALQVVSPRLQNGPKMRFTLAC